MIIPGSPKPLPILLFTLAILGGANLAPPRLVVAAPSNAWPKQHDIVANPSNLSFSSTQVGNSQTVSETLTNSENGSVTISQVTVSGTGFSISGITTPLTLTPWQSTSFSITFTPSSAGNFSGTVSITSDASNPSLSIALSGSGTAAPVHTVSLNWTASTTTGITSYNVYRVNFTSGACGTFPIGSPYGSTASTVTTFTDPTVTDGNTYCYATTAVDASGESGISNVVQVTIP
jgi:hypothetical protein